MQTKFEIGDKVYLIPCSQWGWVESISITKDRISYKIRMPDRTYHYKVESSLKKEYGREKQERK